MRPMYMRVHPVRPLGRPALQHLPLLAFIALVTLVWTSLPSGPELLHGLKNDSAMRLVTIRDLLAGQGWFDPVQTRLGLEGGFAMHWSRLVDAPIAALILGLDLVTSRAQAETLALIVWPLAVLGAVMALATAIGRRLGGAETAAFAGVLAGLILWRDIRFLPGGIDHHNIQIAGLLVVVLGILARHENRAAPVAAGAALVACLAIGMETLPILALAVLGLAALWVLRGDAERAPVLRLVAGALVALAVIFPATAPAYAWRGGMCDALGVDLAVPGALGMGGLAAATLVLHGRGGPLHRALGLAAFWLPAVAVAAFALPSCLSNPLDALHPDLQTRWLALVSEARGIGDLFAGRMKPHLAVYYVAGALALGLAATEARRRRSADWALVAMLIAGALAFTAYQVRGAFPLMALSAPVLGAGLARLYIAWRSGGGPRLLAALIVGVLVLLPSTWASVAIRIAPPQTAPVTVAHADRCITPRAMDALAALPPGVVSAPSNLGAQVLLQTPHRTLSAPYHRNQAGMLAQLDIALAPDGISARAALERHGVDYVVLCPADPEIAALARDGHSGFAKRVMDASRPAGQGQTAFVPGWLDPVAHGDDDSALLIWRVRADG